MHGPKGIPSRNAGRLLPLRRVFKKSIMDAPAEEEPVVAEAPAASAPAAATAAAATTTTTAAEPSKPVAKRAKMEKSDDQAKEIDLPAPTLNRLLKMAVPDAVTSKDAKTAFSKAAGIFVLYITACCNDIVRERKASTVQPSDVLQALKEVGLESFVPLIEEVITEQREISNKRKALRKKQMMMTTSSATPGEAAEGGDAMDAHDASQEDATHDAAPAAGDDDAPAAGDDDAPAAGDDDAPAAGDDDAPAAGDDGQDDA